MNWSKFTLGLFAIVLIRGGLYYLHPSGLPLDKASVQPAASRKGPGHEYSEDNAGRGDRASGAANGAERDGMVAVPALSVKEKVNGEWNPPVQQSFEDAKDFEKNYPKALSHQNFEYAAQLIMRKKCQDLEAGPESEDCLPFLREKVSEEERLFQSDDLAKFYFAAESDTVLRMNAFNAIQRINPRLFKEREPCLHWRMATDVEPRTGFAGECIKVLVKIEAVGEAVTSFWEEYMHLKGVNPARAETFRSEFSPLLLEPEGPGNAQTLPVNGTGEP